MQRGRNAPSTPSAGRGWRAGVLAAGSVALATAAHAAAGGAPPDTGPDVAVTVVLTALVAWAGSAVSWRRPGRAPVLTVVGLLGAGQLVMHLVMSGMHGSASAGDPLPMLATHAVATGLLAWLALRADDALHLLDAVLLHLRGLLRLTHLAGVPGRVIAPRLRPSARGRVLSHLVLRSAQCRRGPPRTS